MSYPFAVQLQPVAFLFLHVPLVEQLMGLLIEYSQ